MKLEEILPEIRAGRKARRRHWVEVNCTNVIPDIGMSLHMANLLADDWELVPEPKKHKVKIYLWSDGGVTTLKDVRWANCDKVVETREIEWSVE
jgi:hypothetical protein